VWWQPGLRQASRRPEAGRRWRQVPRQRRQVLARWRRVLTVRRRVLPGRGRERRRPVPGGRGQVAQRHPLGRAARLTGRMSAVARSGAVPLRRRSRHQRRHLAGEDPAGQDRAGQRLLGTALVGAASPRQRAGLSLTRRRAHRRTSRRGPGLAAAWQRAGLAATSRCLARQGLAGRRLAGRPGPGPQVTSGIVGRRLAESALARITAAALSTGSGRRREVSKARQVDRAFTGIIRLVRIPPLSRPWHRAILPGLWRFIHRNARAARPPGCWEAAASCREWC
jgi:hypothetical protein